MQVLIPVVNRLHDIFHQIKDSKKASSGNIRDLSFNLDLPHLVVVGSQSSGKSSVLEHIVGRDFLPRGSQIVTRCPLILQLVNVQVKSSPSLASSSSSSSSRSSTPTASGSGLAEDLLHAANLLEWGEFLHLPGQKFYNFHDICNEIERQTAKLAGENMGISKTAINLKIYSPYVLDLTLIDLPGLTKIPIGDQPLNIEDQIRSLIFSYISSENSLILAITPANTDLVNSEALKIAREVDPFGVRTIGVLTKLDLMDAGTHALDIILNKGPYRLHHGFIGVVCRSQKDILEEKPIADSLEDEIRFFENHSIYRILSKGGDHCRIGTRHLVRELNRILMEHIHTKLPEIKERVQVCLDECNRLLRDYYAADEILLNDAHVADDRLVLLRCITKYTTDFIQSIQGSWLQSRSTPESSLLMSPSQFSPISGIKSGLVGGARLYALFHEKFSRCIGKLDALTNLTETDIYLAIKNSSGLRPSLFLPETSFEILVKGQIQLLLQPCLEFLDEIHSEILSLLRHCADAPPQGENSSYAMNFTLSSRGLLDRYPNLKRAILKKAEDLLKDRLVPMRTAIQHYIGVESAYINTNHPDFVKASNIGQSILSTGKVSSTSRLSISNKISGRKPSIDISSTVQSQVDHQATTSALMQGLSVVDENQVDSVSNSHNALNPPQPSSPNTNQNNSSSGSSITTNSGILNYFFRGSSMPSNQWTTTGANPPSTPSISIRKNTIGGIGNKSLSISTNPSSSSSTAVSPTGNNNKNHPNIIAASMNPLVKALSPQPHSLTEHLAHPPAIGIGQSTSTAMPNDSVHHSFSNSNLSLSEKDEMDIHVILTLIHSYFGIVKNNVIDFIPKAIMYYIVQYLMDHLQNSLVSSIYLPPTQLNMTQQEISISLSELLQEDECLKQEREMLLRLADVYRTAKDAISDVVDISI